MADKRSEPRKSFVARVELRWKDETGADRSASAILEDRSLSGAGVRTSKPIPVGIQVEIKSQKLTLTGTVKRCVREEFEYIVGIRLDTNTPTE